MSPERQKQIAGWLKTEAKVIEKKLAALGKNLSVASLSRIVGVQH
jgi:hypothetical protein